VINIEWIEGVPERLEVGMVVRMKGWDGPLLVGDFSTLADTTYVTHWAWLIKPYQLSWIDSKMGVPKR
jgi:hypothetical protein